MRERPPPALDTTEQSAKLLPDGHGQAPGHINAPITAFDMNGTSKDDGHDDEQRKKIFFIASSPDKELSPVEAMSNGGRVSPARSPTAKSAPVSLLQTPIQSPIKTCLTPS